MLPIQVSKTVDSERLFKVRIESVAQTDSDLGPRRCQRIRGLHDAQFPLGVLQARLIENTKKIRRNKATIAYVKSRRKGAA